MLSLPHTGHHIHPHPYTVHAAFLFQSVPLVGPLTTYKQAVNCTDQFTDMLIC